MSDDKNVFPVRDGQTEESYNDYAEMPEDNQTGEVYDDNAAAFDYENPYKADGENPERADSFSPFPKVDASSFREVGDDEAYPDDSVAFAESEYIQPDEQYVPEMPVEEPLPSFLAENKSFLSNGETDDVEMPPPMPEEEEQIEIPAMPVGAPVLEEGEDGTVIASDKKKAQKSEVDEKLEAALNSTTRWFKRRRSLLIRLFSTFAILLLVVFALFKLTVSYTSDLMVRKAVNQVNPSVAYFVIQNVNSRSIRLTGLVNKNGNLIAKEVNVTYDLKEFLLNKKIRRLDVRGMDIVVKAEGDSVSIPLLESWRQSGKSNAAPEYSVSTISIQDSKVSVYGHINESASFTADGSLNGSLNLSATLTMDSNTLKGQATADLSGWAGNFGLTFKSGEMSYVDSNSYESGITLNFDLKSDSWQISNLKADYVQHLGKYDIVANADAEYVSGTLNADLSVKTSIDKTRKTEDTGRMYGDFDNYDYEDTQNDVYDGSRRYLRARMAAAETETAEASETSEVIIPIPDDLIETYPLGEVKLKIKQAKMKFYDGIAASSLPLEVSVTSGKWGNIALDKANFKLNGSFECKKDKCSYLLKDNASLSLDGLKTPAFNSQFEMTDSLDVRVLKSSKPLFEVSSDNLAFNANVEGLDLRGSIAGVTKQNILRVNAGESSVSGFVNNDKYSVAVYLGKFDYSDSYYQIKKGYLHSVISSSSLMGLRLKAAYFDMKDGLVDIAPMAFELDAAPDNGMHKFKALWSDKDKGFSLQARGLYDSVRDRGTARFTLSPFTVGPDNRLEDIFPVVNKYATDISGQIAAEGTLNWMYSYITGPVKLTLKDVNFKRGYLDVKGLNTSFSLTNINPPTTVRGQAVAAASVDAMLPFKDVKMNLSIAENGNLTISNMTSELFGGKVSTIGGWLISDSNTSPYMLIVKSGKLQNVMKYLNLSVDMEGDFDARLPILATDSDVSVSLGDIRSVGDGYIRYTGAGNNRAARTLSSLNYKNFVATLDASLQGNTRIRMAVDGINPAVNGEKRFQERLDLEGKTKNILK